MIGVLLRRVRTQWPVLTALLLLITVGPTLIGAGALLVTRTATRALEINAMRAPAGEVQATAYLVNVVGGPGTAAVATDTRTLLTTAYQPFRTTTTMRASSALRSLPERGGEAAEAYLSGVDDLPGGADLVSGRWPGPHRGTGPTETAVLESTARLLGLRPGDRVHLGEERSIEPAPALDLTVVGVVRPRPGAGWDRDPLLGAGYDAAFGGGGSPQAVRAYGPFLVDLPSLLAGGSALTRLEITARPDLTGATLAGLNAADRSLAGADRRLGGVLGRRVQVYRVAAGLPSTMADARAQQGVITAVVLAVVVIGCALTATALVLAGRLTADVRSGETELLSALGVSRGQFALAAVAEAGALALLAALIAVPGSAVLHSGLTHLPQLVRAGLAVAPGTNATHLIAVTAGALAMAVLLVVLAVRPVAAPGDRRRRVDLLARSGADVLLVVLAAVGWWQLRGQPAAGTDRADAVRVVAPALLLAAGAALVLRLVPPLLRRADRLARRARGLVVPLAAFEVARRPHAVAAGLLVTLACAAVTFGAAFDATWTRSQQEQADLSVGTDLRVAVTGVPVAADGPAVAAASGGTVSPVTDRGVVVGQWVGGAGDPPRMIAVDTRHSGALLRGRSGAGPDWAAAGAGLAPATRVTGIGVPAGAALTLRGTSGGPDPIALAPRLLIQDASGMRTSCVAAPVLLDGTTRRLPGCTTGPGQQLVAVALAVQAPEGVSSVAPNTIEATLTVPGTGGAGWSVTSAAPASDRLTSSAVQVRPDGSGTRLTLTTSALLTGPDRAARTLVATAFEPPGPVPVAISRRLADDVGLDIGKTLDVPIGVTAVPVRVTAVLPVVPSAPGVPAMLADVDTLSRALAVHNDFQFPLDAWWVGGPAGPGAAERVAALGLGPVTTRAGETDRLLNGPTRAGLPPALRLLLLAGALLLVIGVVVHVNTDLQVRAVEVARLRGIGLTRRETRRVLLGQHAGVLLPLVLAGALVGWLTSRVVAPLMVRSETGAAPVPAAVPRWPWAVEAGLVAALLTACVLAVVVVVLERTRRADAAHLRVTT